MPTKQPFSRLPVPRATPDVQAAVSDVYDKLAQITQGVQTQVGLQVAPLAKQVAALQTGKADSVPSSSPGAPLPSQSIAGATGLAADPQFAFIPALAAVPSATPGSSIYTKDGLLIEVTAAPSSPGQFWRYDAASIAWAGPFGGTGSSIADTHAKRDVAYPASNYPVGTLYSEIDRQAVYYSDGLEWVLDVGHGHGILASRYADLGTYDTGYTWDTLSGISYYWDGTQWNYTDGIEYLSLAAFLLRTWGVGDDRYLVAIYDYAHTIVYTGGSGMWSFSPSDPGSKFIVPSPDANPPNGGVWQLCDGSAVLVFRILAGVPGTVSVTTPDLTGDVFIRGAAYTGTVNPSTSPTFSGAGLTFTGTPFVLTGSVAAPVFSGTALGTHQHAVPIGLNGTQVELNNSYGTTSAGHSGANNWASSAGGALFSDINTSSVSSGTPAGTNSAPVLTMNSYTPVGTITGSGTVSAPVVGTGAPKSIALQFYMRR